MAGLRIESFVEQEVMILLTNQRTLHQQRGNKKMGWSGAVPLVPFTTFSNGNAKITVLMCNELNWTAWRKRHFSNVLQ